MKAAPGILLILCMAIPLGAESGEKRAALLGWVDSENAVLKIQVPRFDDPKLRDAVLRAAGRGAKVRLILSRREKTSRLAARSLRAAGAQVRWALKIRSRLAVGSGWRLALGDFDGTAESLDHPDTGLALIEDATLAREFNSRFEKEWSGLAETLPSETELKDELESLPDPRENEPRIKTKRRKN